MSKGLFRRSPEVPVEQEQYFDLVQDSGRLMGFSGLEVAIKPGGGFSTEKRKDKIIVNVDPQQMVKKEGAEANPSHVTFAVFHELGHVKDMMHTKSKYESEDMTPKDHFFWNLLDDAVINRRLRNIPQIDACTEEVYTDILFPVQDLSNMPKHVQLMEAILLGNTTNLSDHYKFSDEIEETLYSLRNFAPDEDNPDATFDVIKIMSQPITSYEKRVQIGESIIRPIYDRLYVEDLEEQKQNQANDQGQSGDGQQQQGSPTDSFEQSYADYEEVMHCEMPKSDDEQESASQSQSGDEESEDQQEKEQGNDESEADSEDKAPESLHDAMKEAMDKLDEQDGNQSQSESENAPEPDYSKDELQQLAGTIAKEMDLSEGDAMEYARAIIELRSDINQVANAFMKLALPTTTISSPRYARHPELEGHKLDAKKLAKVGVQIATGEDQEIWLPTELRGKNQLVDFGGLDINLLVDVSASMSGKPARSASKVGLLLLEGLDLARNRIQKRNQSQKNPDVRVQTIAFGSSMEVLSPIAFKAKPQDKARTFTNLSNPHSGATLVNRPLQLIDKMARENPKRQQLVIVITDGAYGDEYEAVRTIQNYPKNVAFAEFNVGYNYQYDEPHREYSGKDRTYDVNPATLPARVSEVIRSLV